MSKTATTVPSDLEVYRASPIPIDDLIQGEIGVLGRERAKAILSMLEEDYELERPTQEDDWSPSNLNSYLLWELLESLNKTSCRNGFSDFSEHVAIEKKCGKRKVRPTDFPDLRNRLMCSLKYFLNGNNDNTENLENLPKEAKKVTITRFTNSGAVCTNRIYLPNGAFDESLKGKRLPEIVVVPAPELDDGGNRDVYKQFR